MPDLDPNDVPSPIQVNTSLVMPQVMTGLRDFGVMVTFVTAVLGFVSKRDLSGAIAYLQSVQALPAVSIIVWVAIVGYRQWKTRRDKTEKIALAHAAPDSVAKVV